MYLENSTDAKDSVLSPVQEHRKVISSHGCKVTMVFSRAADESIRREVAEMLLAAFERKMAKENEKHEARIELVQGEH